MKPTMSKLRLAEMNETRRLGMRVSAVAIAYVLALCLFIEMYSHY